MTLVIIALVAIVTFTAINVSQLDSRASLQEYTATRALYAARAGLNFACTRLSDQYNWTGVTAMNINNAAGQETFTITVTPASWNGSATNNSNNRWRISSTGSFQGASRTLIGFAEVEPFSKYAYFTDQETSSGGGRIRFAGGDILTGAVHTNGFFTFAGLTNFTDRVTSHNNKDATRGPTDAAYNPGPPKSYSSISSGGYSSSSTTNSTQFYQYDTGLSLSTAGPQAHGNSTTSPYFSFQGGSSYVPLPGTSPTPYDPLNTIKQNATYAATNATGHTWANATNAPNDRYRVTYDEAGGSNGTITTFQKSTNGGSSWSNVNENQAPPVYKVVFTESPPRATIYRKEIGGSGNNFVQQGSPIPTDTQPGVTLFMDGLTTVHGTVRGRVTLGSAYDMHIVGNLTYANTTRDVLGIVGGGNILVESALSDGSDKNLHAIMMTPRGSFQVDRYDQRRGTGATPYLRILGGLIQDTRGAVGQSGSPVRGYYKDYKYDNKLLSTPPLNFPTTGKVIVSAIRDQGALGSQ